MAKVTSKLQVTLPKRIAEKHGLAPGDDIEFQSAGDIIRIVPAASRRRDMLDTEERLRLFDEATRRIEARAAQGTGPGEALTERDPKPDSKRDSKREDLYTRGSSD